MSASTTSKKEKNEVSLFLAFAVYSRCSYGTGATSVRQLIKGALSWPPVLLPVTVKEHVARRIECPFESCMHARARLGHLILMFCLQKVFCCCGDSLLSLVNSFWLQLSLSLSLSLSLQADTRKSLSFAKRLRQKWEWERERGGGGSGRGHERRARKRTGWKVHIESKTQVCWLTSVLAIDVHENALTAQDTSVSRIHLSSARLEKSDAWPASGHSFYDEPWTQANCHVRALTWAPTASISARQSHLLHLQSPLFGYVPRSGGENVKETTWTNQHTSPGGEGKEEEGREEKRGKGRRYSVSLRRKTGQTEAGWVEGSINSFAAGAPTLKSAAENPRNNVNLVICLLGVNTRKSLSFAKRLRQKWEWERERGGGGGKWPGSRETSSKTNWLEGPHWIKDTSVLTYLRLGDWRPRERTHCPGH